MPAQTLDPQILDRLKTILRRDLKLGPTAPIADDMPFFGGDVDVDSLDILLLVTSIEKEFGIKVPNAAVGKQVFENVTTLAAFIQENKAGAAPGAPAAGAAAPPVDFLSRLPHQPPFRFVSQITDLREGDSAEGVWSLTGNEPFFTGHFPGRPLVPGVLIAEALAQLSGLAGPRVAEQEEGKLAHVDVRFEAAVPPPAQIVLKTKLVRVIGALQQFNVEASSAGTTIARGSLTLHRAARNGGAA
ncbi:MAG TPA: phosphopantetheine-binding protein [Tepidisphaeraceae bacterium]|jgi:3-hydroxyacyl-[acyl-carrier-protein] dehydratase